MGTVILKDREQAKILPVAIVLPAGVPPQSVIQLNGQPGKRRLKTQWKRLDRNQNVRNGIGRGRIGRISAVPGVARNRIPRIQTDALPVGEMQAQIAGVNIAEIKGLPIIALRVAIAAKK